MKDLPETKAVKWGKGIDKDIQKMKTLITEIEGSAVSQSYKKHYTDKFGDQIKAFESLQTGVLAATSENAEYLITHSKRTTDQYAKLVKDWKKFKAACPGAS